ncbi:hypothetical protein [Melaminivora sp.]|uniref:hypothetical protein n=1 Tax=Melaminivora sp. TaxID=1933032 RepID=UPI0028A85348|nr:hypothetical protein [Melaminivora sp.]
MARPKRVRETTHPIGQRINLVLSEKGIPGDYSALAKHFGVAVTSVYGWVEKGRISKSRLPLLAEWSGRPLDWWLEGSSPIADEELEENTRILAELRNWRLRASSRSQAVIDQLCVLAQANALREEDWTLIEQTAAHLRSRR